MYRNGKNPDEKRFYRLLQKELERCCQSGTKVFAEGRTVSPKEAVENWIAGFPGECWIESIRDGAGRLVCLYIYRVGPEDFVRNGREIRRTEKIRVSPALPLNSAADRAIKSNYNGKGKEKEERSRHVLAQG